MRSVFQSLNFTLFQIVSINEDADSLISFYPDAVDHILAKRRELLRAIEKLGNRVRDRDEQVFLGSSRAFHFFTQLCVMSGLMTKIPNNCFFHLQYNWDAPKH